MQIESGETPWRGMLCCALGLGVGASSWGPLSFM